MLSLWAIGLSTAATLNPRRNTQTHSGNPFLIFGQYTWPKWHLEFYYYAETSAITTITTTNWHHLQVERREKRLGCWSVAWGGGGVCGFTLVATPFGAIEFLWKPHKFRGIFNSVKPFLPLCPRLPTNLGQFIAFGQFVKCHSREF